MKFSTWCMALHAERTSIKVVGLGPSEMLGEVEEGLSLGFGLVLIGVRYGEEEVVWRSAMSCSSRWHSRAMARRRQSTVRLDVTRGGLNVESMNGSRDCSGVSTWRGSMQPWALSGTPPTRGREAR